MMNIASIIENLPAHFPNNPVRKTILVAVIGFFHGLFWMIYDPFSPKEHTSAYVYQNVSIQDPSIHEAVFHSPNVFKINYKEMEKKFRVHVYLEQHISMAESPQYWIRYEKEINFRKKILNSRFSTDNPEKADLFFIPIPCVKMAVARDLKEQAKLIEELNEELEIDLDELLFDYPLWNKTFGADHFFMTCDEAAVIPPSHAQFLSKNSIQVLWSASYNDFNYIPHKDIVLPEILPEFALQTGDTNSATRSEETNQLTVWNIEGEHEVTALPMDAFAMQFSSPKYCICPRGDQLIGTHIATAIHYGCVPVILYDYNVLPFNDILDWSKFSVIIKESDAYHLKEILQAIPSSEYKELQANVVKVRRHFEWNSPPKKYDAFHMAMYELWLRHHVIRYSNTTDLKEVSRDIEPHTPIQTWARK